MGGGFGTDGGGALGLMGGGGALGLMGGGFGTDGGGVWD